MCLACMGLIWVELNQVLYLHKYCGFIYSSRLPKGVKLVSCKH